ncbi:FecR domain-containing protein [Candidimonas humi]|uniref:FecR domain-containing protein n=1 Tax=Candidimonas humi TaxID=683355 RepID=A0ABV8P226_9BURK|nr:FecR domain-containing protein [Candidimonas humi]MBV6303920.1 FecR domain-containing protein [Candidimonas humi]
MEDSARSPLDDAVPGAAPAVAGESGSGHIPEAIVERAVAWYVRLASGTATARDRAEFGRWRAAHPDHAQAWARLEHLGTRLQGSAARVAPALARATLARAASFSSRRRAFKRLAWIGAGGAGLYLFQDQVPWRSELAIAFSDVHTPTGERRSMVLADGTRLLLNTATAVELRFGASERRIVLRSGEIMVATAKDPGRRPFIVATADGELRPIGTRFTVRRDADAGDRRYTQLAVTEGAVQVRAMHAGSLLVQAHQQVRFTSNHIETPVVLDEDGQGWIRGMFSAEGMRLADFVAELSRYRHGRLRCAPEVANLRITGVWPLDSPDATERILDSLERRLPVRIVRYTRYWVTVAAR